MHLSLEGLDCLVTISTNNSRPEIGNKMHPIYTNTILTHKKQEPIFVEIHLNES